MQQLTYTCLMANGGGSVWKRKRQGGRECFQTKIQFAPSFLISMFTLKTKKALFLPWLFVPFPPCFLILTHLPPAQTGGTHAQAHADRRSRASVFGTRGTLPEKATPLSLTPDLGPKCPMSAQTPRRRLNTSDVYFSSPFPLIPSSPSDARLEIRCGRFGALPILLTGEEN